MDFQALRLLFKKNKENYADVAELVDCGPPLRDLLEMVRRFEPFRLRLTHLKKSDILNLRKTTGGKIMTVRNFTSSSSSYGQSGVSMNSYSYYESCNDSGRFGVTIYEDCRMPD